MNHIPSLAQAWRRTFWHCYDHLGLLILLSLFWLLGVFTIILLPAATAALYHMALLIIRGEKVSVKILFRILPKYFIKSTSLALTLILIIFIFIINIRFYLLHLGLFGFMLAGISFWLFILTLVTSIYILPVLCLGKGYKETLRYSLLLALSNPRFSIGFFLSALALLFFEIFLPIIGIGILSVFSQEAFREVQARYDGDIKITEPKRSLKELLRPWEFS